MAQKRRRFSPVFPCVVLGVLFLSVFFARDLEEMERGVYSAFCESFLADGDLNIFNHVVEVQRWLVTPSFNHPASENHGSVIFWSPFYAIAHAFPKSWGAMPALGLTAYELIALFRNAIFATIAGYLLLRILAFVESRTPGGPVEGRRLRVISGGILLSCPLFAYLFLIPFSCETTNFLLSSAIVFHLLKMAFVRPGKLDLAAAGVFVAAATVFKVSFAAFVAPYLFLALLAGGRKGELPKRLGAVLAGFLTMIALQTINYSVQMGELTLSSHFASLDSARSDSGFALTTFLGVPNGWLVASPIVLVLFLLASCVLATCLATLRRKRALDPADKASLALSAIVVGHVASTFWALKNVPTYPDNFSARVFVNLVVPGIALVALRRRTLLGSDARWFASAAVVAACAAISFVHVSNFFFSGGPTYAGAPDLRAMADLFKPGMVWARATPGELALYLVTCVSAALLGQAAWQSARNAGVRFTAAFRVAAAGSFLIYLAVTASNIRNNPKKVARLKESGAFSRTVVSGDRRLSYYDEVMSVLEWGIQGLPAGQARIAQRLRASYAQEVAGLALADPIGFRSQYEKGVIRPSVDALGKPYRWIPGAE